MKAWSRLFTVSLFAGCLSLANLHAATAAEHPDADTAPKKVTLHLYHIEGAKADTPVIEKAIAIFKKIFADGFPQFNSFKKLADAEKSLDAETPAVFNMPPYRTVATLEEFVAARDGDGRAIWKTKVKLEFFVNDKPINNPVIQILPGGQHTWVIDEKHIFILHQPDPGLTTP